MSDGHSFYLVFAIFYLLECLKFAPPASIAMTSHRGGARTWRPHAPFLVAWGIRKLVFIGPLLPWPSLIYAVSGWTEREHLAKPVRTVSAVRRRLRFLEKATLPLRLLSLLTLLNFFAVLPFVYQQSDDEVLILAFIGAAYLALPASAIHFFLLHRRLLPGRQGDRLKSTLYTAFLPWHAMRCADELFLRCAEQWSPLAALAANANSPAATERLKLIWRRAHFSPSPPYSAKLLQSVFAQAAIDTSSWLLPPAASQHPKYCPCCHCEYKAFASHCADCRDQALRPIPKRKPSLP